MPTSLLALRPFALGLTLGIAIAGLAPAAHAQSAPPAGEIRLTPVEMFTLADKALAAGDPVQARAILAALSTNPDPEYRNEARFRLARLLVAAGQLEEASTRLEQLLAERPDAAPALLLLAQVEAQRGNLGAARRRLAHASRQELPEGIEQMVDKYRAALRSSRPMGVSIDLGLAADSNINRATRSDVLGTVIGDFTLDEDARETSGTGVRGGIAAYARLPVARDMGVLARVNTGASLYKDKQFNDVAVGAALGPEWSWRDARLQLAGAAGWRWFGGRPYTREYGADARGSLAIGHVGHVTLSPAWRRIDDARSNARDGDRYTLALAIDRPLTPRLAARLTGQVGRMDARSPTESHDTWGAGALASLDRREATYLLTADYSRLTADARVFLYPEIRRDRTLSLSMGAVVKALAVGGFAPRVELTRTHATSSIEIYDYRRTALEFGVQRVF